MSVVLVRLDSLPSRFIGHFKTSALRRYFLLVLVLWALDLLIKWGITQSFDYAQRFNVMPFFDLILVHNKGAAFSFLASQSGWQRWFFSFIALAISIYLIVWLRNTPRTQTLLGLSLSLLLSGALGNLVDRVVNGYVVDYLLVYYPPYYFPAFNLADSLIFIGVVGLLIDFWQTEKATKRDTKH
jgi:signal peptidase II|tara:strand:- start:1952 stop:2503 length:552 start_codon:yes stop_codon:yes gene_type:complete